MAPRKTPAAKTQAEEASQEDAPKLVTESPETDPKTVPVISKSAASRMKAVEEAIVEEAAKGVHFAEEEIVKVVHNPEVEKLEKTSVEDLRKLHDEAIIAEDAVKRQLNVARQRAANMSTKVDDVVDREIIALKKKATELHDYIKQLEEKLSGELKDIWGTTF